MLPIRFDALPPEEDIRRLLTSPGGTLALNTANAYAAVGQYATAWGYRAEGADASARRRRGPRIEYGNGGSKEQSIGKRSLLVGALAHFDDDDSDRLDDPAALQNVPGDAHRGRV